MDEKVFLKTENDGLWQNNPHLAFGILLFISIILFFLIFIICSFFFSSGVVIFILTIIFFACCGIIPAKINNDKNISKSIGFIKRNNNWYAIKLMYDQSEAGNILNMPSGSVAQTASVSHNYKVASNIQKNEKKIKDERNDKTVYIKVLDEVLKTFEDDKFSKPIYSEIDKKLDSSLNGYSFNEIYTINGTLCGYIILKNLSVEKVDKKYITLSFDDERGNRSSVKFRNVYKGLVEEINNN